MTSIGAACLTSFADQALHARQPLLPLLTARCCRVKRSLNGAVAAAGGTAAATLARRSLDAPPVASAQQVAGISRKRLEAELLSPPLPRKSSRTLMDGEHAADMLARLHLAGPTGGAMQCEPAPRFAH